MGLNELRRSASLTEPSVIRERLPLQYVMEREGIVLEERGSRLVGLCCFHNDTNPSLQMYKDENDIERFGCFACDSFGDVIDFIRKSDGLDFKKSLDKANELIKELEGTHWKATVLEDRVPYGNFTVEVEAAYKNDLQPFIDMVFEKKWPIDPEYIAEIFNIGTNFGNVIIPYFSEGSATGYKIRTRTSKLSAPGSKFKTFYGEWLDQGRTNVILTEGEPDTWTAYTFLHNFDVLGLPTGAASSVRTEILQDRDVVLAFDGDQAGRNATRKWVDALEGIASSVRIVRMPDGYDLAMLTDVRRAVEEAQPLLPNTGNIYQRNGYFERAIKGKDEISYEPIANWGFEPTKELKSSEGGVAYEGLITPGKNLAVISSDDLSSATKAHNWAQFNGLGWRGTDKDARDILIWLESQGPYLAAGRMTRVLGLHDRHFVLPDRTIGEEQWVFVPKPGIVTKYLNFEQNDNVFDIMTAVLKLHRRGVLDPILAWQFAAPLRSLFDEFPILGIYGSSGVGKTTLLKTLLAAISGGSIGGKDGISLADTTKHAITENVGATNAFPVWFDEHRASIKSDTRDALHNILLAAYIGQTTSKGAVTDRGLGVTNWEHNAPIIVSGETTFEETAHVERMVTVPLPINGRNASALRQLQTLLPSGVSNAYLLWLINKADLDFRVRPAYELDLPSRVQTNIGVLRLGWAFMREFLEFYEINDPGEPDFSLLIDEAKNIANEEPLLEAIRWALESTSALKEPLVIVIEDEAYIRVTSLVAVVRKDNLFPLAGNAKSVRRLLTEKYNGTEVVRSFQSHGVFASTRFIKVDATLLGLVN